jgi:hypothetical protein
MPIILFFIYLLFLSYLLFRISYIQSSLTVDSKKRVAGGAAACEQSLANQIDQTPRNWFIYFAFTIDGCFQVPSSASFLGQ